MICTALNEIKFKVGEYSYLKKRWPEVNAVVDYVLRDRQVEVGYSFCTFLFIFFLLPIPGLGTSHGPT